MKAKEGPDYDALNRKVQTLATGPEDRSAVERRLRRLSVNEDIERRLK